MKYIIIVLVAIALFNCNSRNNAKSLNIENDTASTPHPERATSEVPAVNIYHPVQKIQQPDSMSCWAAALTMLYSHRLQRFDLQIRNILAPLGSEYVNIFTSNSGITPAQESALYQKAGLKVIHGQNPSIPAWKALLESKGPLSVTVDADIDPRQERFAPHALLVNGLSGDLSPAGTSITYVDPANGVERSVSFADFLHLYEGSASWPLQIIHW